MQNISVVIQVLPIALVIIISGCGSDTTGIDRSVGGVEAMAKRMGEVGEIGDEVMAYGVEPRRELRYEWESGQVERMSMVMEIEMAMGGQVEKIRPPAATMLADIEIIERVAEGYRVTIEMTGVDAGAGADPLMQMELNKLIGVRGSGTISDRGEAMEMSIDIPEGVEGAARGNMEQAGATLFKLPVLPEEPVGIGAKWLNWEPLENHGLKGVHATLYTLERIEGDTLYLSMEFGQHAPRQSLQADGRAVTMMDFRGSGEGTMTIDLARVVPDSTVEMNSSFTQAAAGQSVSMKMEVYTRTSRLEGEDAGEGLDGE